MGVWGTGTRSSADRAGVASRPRAASVQTPEAGDRRRLPLTSALTTPEPGSASSVRPSQAPSSQMLHPPHRSCLRRGSLVQPHCFLLDIFRIVQVHPCIALSPSCISWSLSLVVVLVEGNLRPGKLIKGLCLKISMSHPLARYKSVQNDKS